MSRYGTILLGILFLLLVSCEEVIKVELEESEPRLVIEASLIWIIGSDGKYQSIQISETSAFYKEELTAVETANVRVISEEGVEFNFEHRSNGLYVNSGFHPELNKKYELEVKYDGDLYTASEKLVPVSGIDYVAQTQNGGFAGDEYEIKAYYTDPANEENYYLFKFIDENVFLEFYEDEFTNGNQIFGYFSNEEIERGDEILIQMEGISKEYYEFLFILRSQIGTNEGGPFETMPATVKGNIINRSTPEKYPLGYFRLSQADSTSYEVQ